MRRISLILVPFLTAIAAASAMAQAPVPAVEAGGRCPAEVLVVWDVSSVQGATNARIRVRRGTEVLENRAVDGTSGRTFVDLRTLGRPVLDGSAWSVQLRPRAGETNLTGWSEATPIDLPTLTPQLVLADLATQLELSWDLAPEPPWAACADRVAWEVKAGTFASATEADPAATSGTENGVSALELVADPGGELVSARIVARHGGDSDNDDIGRWSDAEVVEPPQNLVFHVRAVDADATECSGLTVPRTDALVGLIVDGFEHSLVTVLPNGQASVQFLAPNQGNFEWRVVAPAGAGSCSARLPAVPGEEVVASLQGCAHPNGDRSVTFGAVPGFQAGIPLRLILTVTAEGGVLAPGGTLAVQRVSSSGAQTEIGHANVRVVCPGQPRTVTFVDRNPGRANEVQYKATIEPADWNPSNDGPTLRLRNLLGRPPR